jgi:glycosyltransferase involved in cell wall biosynthesis
MKSEPRVAFVIDSLPSLGGGEKVLFAALEAYPRAELFTLIYNRDFFVKTPLANRRVNTSYLNVLPLARKHHRYFLPLMPSAIEQFDLRDYDIIVCFSYAVAHGVRNYNGARHVSYTFTPMRYAWTDLNIDGTHTRRNPLLDRFMQAFRNWDGRAASRVHEFAAISQAVSSRIQRAYHRTAPVIYPPVDLERFRPQSQRADYCITITRLVAHKRVDLLVRAFSELNLPLIVVGEGPELPRLKKLAKPNIHFVGYESDERVADLLGKARGFVSAAEEDFGIAIVEAQAAGCPVISYGKGGALETVIEGVTGLFFEEQSTAGLIDALEIFEGSADRFNPADMMQNASRFSKPRFIREFQEFVSQTGTGENHRPVILP